MTGSRALSKSYGYVRGGEEKKGENQILSEKVLSANKSMNFNRNTSYSQNEKGPENLKIHVNGLIESGKVGI